MRIRFLHNHCPNVFPVVPGERQRGPGPIRRSPSIVHSVWVPAFAGTTARVCSRARILQFNCQTALANAPPPVFFVEAPGRPVFHHPSHMRGDGAPYGATSSPTPYAALTCLCDRHVRHTALHRGFSVPGTVLPGADGRPYGQLYPGSFRRPSSTPRPAIQGGPT